MVKRLGILTHAVLWLILSVMAVSCASVEEPSQNNVEHGSTISFKFNIYTEEKGIASRALGVWEENAANIAERILSVDDMRILLFDQSGLLLKVLRPSLLSYHGSDATNDGYYTLSVAFTHDYFDKFDNDAVIPFTVMILANLEGIGGRYTDLSPGNTRVSDVVDSFQMNSDYFPTETTGIPMYGIKSLSVAKELLTQGVDAPFAGQIDMIRSLCRIDVSERIANAILYPDGKMYPKVTDVEMVSWVDRGYIRPRFDDYSQGLRFANVFPSLPVSTPATARKTSDIFRLYCPEADVKDMKFRVTAILSPQDSPRQFEIGLGDFESEIGGELVRNHIYRFDIHAFNTMLDLDVEESDWTVQHSEFELDDIVSMEPDGFLKWKYDDRDFSVSIETYNGEQEQQLSILNGTSSYASGSFHILSPKGATWKAYFIPGENGVDAFEFVDVDDNGNVIAGSEKVFAEGIVGEPAIINIRGKGVADAYRHWAELVVEVRTLDGTVLYAPLTPSMSSRFIIYRENKL